MVCNAKTRRVSVCNALDCLVIHRGRLTDLPELCAPLAGAHVTVYADEEAFAALDGHYPAGLLEHAAEEHFGTEFLDYKLAVKTVASLDGALAHIARYSSRHSEAIVTENKQAATQFTRSVDAACVYVNVSTAFTDGGQFGFDAETPRPRPDGTARAHDLQVYRLGRRTNPPTLNPDTTKNLEKTAGKITIRKHFFCKFAYP